MKRALGLYILTFTIVFFCFWIELPATVLQEFKAIFIISFTIGTFVNLFILGVYLLYPDLFV